jgi:hypothetical protein
MSRPDRSHIFRRLDSIEDKQGKMIHEIAELKGPMQSWQNGLMKDHVFFEILAKYIDHKEEN